MPPIPVGQLGHHPVDVITADLPTGRPHRAKKRSSTGTAPSIVRRLKAEPQRVLPALHTVRLELHRPDPPRRPYLTVDEPQLKPPRPHLPKT